MNEKLSTTTNVTVDKDNKITSKTINIASNNDTGILEPTEFGFVLKYFTDSSSQELHSEKLESLFKEKEGSQSFTYVPFFPFNGNTILLHSTTLGMVSPDSVPLFKELKVGDKIDVNFDHQYNNMLKINSNPGVYTCKNAEDDMLGYRVVILERDQE